MPAEMAEPALPVAITRGPDALRFNLRIDPGATAAASRAFGLKLPEAIGQAAREDQRRALRLGPDEWVLSADPAARDAISAGFAALERETPLSLVDISDREVALRIEGPQAATLLSVGCPINLARIAVGAGARTVFDGVQVVLFRDAVDGFTLEVWRSFVPHVTELLEIANRELAIGL